MLIDLQYALMGTEYQGIGAHRTVNQVLIYCSVAGGLMFGVAHIIDFQFLKRRSGITSWIFTLLGVVSLLAVTIISVIGQDRSQSFLSLSPTLALTELILGALAIVFLSLSGLFSGLQSRRVD
jgi:hypothetical protein